MNIAVILPGLLAALLVPAPAQDLDRVGADVPRVVAQAKSAAKAMTAELDGKGTAAKLDDGSFERRIVVFEPGTSAARKAKAIGEMGGVVLKDLWIVDAVAAAVPKSRLNRFDVVNKSRSDVVRVQKDVVRNWLKQAGPSTPAQPQPQRVPWGVERVGAQRAWSVTRGEGVKVAVVDTGVDLKHTDLKVKGGHNCLFADYPAQDEHGHGTFMAGVIAAQDNSEGVVGIAPGVDLYAVKVVNGKGLGGESDMICGIQWAVENKMDVVNFSLGSSDERMELLGQAMKKAAEAGVVVVAAAGNTGRDVEYPAAYPWVIAVGSADNRDQAAETSSRGKAVAFIAPGMDVESTFLGGGYRKSSGTSVAAPHVTALAALAIASQGVHGMEPVKKVLQRASKKLPYAAADQQGAGMIDAGLVTAPRMTAR